MFPLYCDENAQARILLTQLRSVAVDWLLSNEAGTSGLTGEQQLAFAADAGRAIRTHDERDFQRLHGAWSRLGRDHAGIVIVTDPHTPPSVVFAKVMRLQAERTTEDMRNAILFLGPTRLEEPE